MGIMAKQEEGGIAAQVDGLLALAKKTVKQNPERAKKYVSLARKIAMRNRVPLGRKRKLLFCQKCGAPWIAGYNLKVRIRSREGKIAYICACGHERKVKYKKITKK